MKGKRKNQVVVCAAIRVGDLIFCSARHCDPTMHNQARAAGIKLSKGMQGFINQFGEFLTREEAKQVAISAGQKINAVYPSKSKDLFSEDLY